jgi:hypothetical protein
MRFPDRRDRWQGVNDIAERAGLDYEDRIHNCTTKVTKSTKINLDD